VLSSLPEVAAAQEETAMSVIEKSNLVSGETKLRRLGFFPSTFGRLAKEVGFFQGLFQGDIGLASA